MYNGMAIFSAKYNLDVHHTMDCCDISDHAKKKQMCVAEKCCLSPNNTTAVMQMYCLLCCVSHIKCDLIKLVRM